MAVDLIDPFHFSEISSNLFRDLIVWHTLRSISCITTQRFSLALNDEICTISQIHFGNVNNYLQWRLLLDLAMVVTGQNVKLLAKGIQFSFFSAYL